MDKAYIANVGEFERQFLPKTYELRKPMRDFLATDLMGWKLIRSSKGGAGWGTARGNAIPIDSWAPDLNWKQGGRVIAAMQKEGWILAAKLLHSGDGTAIWVSPDTRQSGEVRGEGVGFLEAVIIAAARAKGWKEDDIHG